MVCVGAIGGAVVIPARSLSCSDAVGFVALAGVRAFAGVGGLAGGCGTTTATSGGEGGTNCATCAGLPFSDGFGGGGVMSRILEVAGDLAGVSFAW